MRRPVFGRRTTPPGVPPAAVGTPAEDRAAVLAELAPRGTDAPYLRGQAAGKALVGQVVGGRGARAEDVVAILAACGGYAVIVAALEQAAASRDAALPAGVTQMRGADRQIYWFGELPDRLLLEDRDALLSLALGAAQALGAELSLEQVREAMRRAAATAGGPEFAEPALPDAHRPDDSALDYVRYVWPQLKTVLEDFAVPVPERPAAFGFALQHALGELAAALAPDIAARIILEYAVPMARIDPARFGEEHGR